MSTQTDPTTARRVVGRQFRNFRRATILLRSLMGRPRRSACLGALVVLLGFSAGSCRSFGPAVPRYTVTATPLDVIGGNHPGLCIAVDPSDKQGVWWWEPSPAGCSTSINFPRVFPAQQATVARAGSVVDVRFELQLHRPGPLHVALQIQDGDLQDVGSGMRVSTAPRSNLDIAPAYGR